MDWVTEVKRRTIKRYVEASWAACQKTTSQHTYIDLFGGTGRVRVKHTQPFQDAGPLSAWRIAQRKQSVLSDFFIADANPKLLTARDAQLRRHGAPITVSAIQIAILSGRRKTNTRNL
jgi:three-Cys-motif partner protein